MLRTYLFGQPKFEYNQKSLIVSAQLLTLPLWAYLLLHRQLPLRRPSVATAVYSDESESSARANLRRHLHYRLRELLAVTLGVPWFLAEGDTLHWNPAAEWWLDLAEFTRLSNDPGRLSEAATLYSGDVLENLYEDGLFFGRERLRDLYFGVFAQHLSERLLPLVRSHRIGEPLLLQNLTAVSELPPPCTSSR